MIVTSFISLFCPTPSQAASTQVLILPGAGTTKLDATLFLPSKLPAPAILLAHGLGETKDSVAPLAATLQANGFEVLTWSARGFGKSTGEISFDSLNGEVADAHQLVNFLQSQKSVATNQAGQKLIGVAGGSYGGALALLLAGSDQRIGAVSADITWNNLAQALFPQSALSEPSAGPFKKLWASTLFTLSALPASYLGPCGAITSQWCQLYQQAALTGQLSPAGAKLLQQSSPDSVTSKISAPTLLMQGEDDSLFPLTESLKTAGQIKQAHPETPVSLIWHTGGHDGGQSESDRLNKLTIAWFNKYLREKPEQIPTFAVTDPTGAISLTDSTALSVVATSSQLPINLPNLQLELSQSQPAVLLSPVGASPAALSSIPGFGGAAGALSGLANFSSAITSSAGGSASSALAGNFSPAFLPGQSSLLLSAPQKTAANVVGSGRIKLHLTSTSHEATLFFSLVDKTPTGIVKQVDSLVAPIQIKNIPATGKDFWLELPSVFLKAGVGDQLGIGISSTDQGYAMPTDSRIYTVTPISSLYLPSLQLSLQTSGAKFWIWPLALVGSCLIAGGYLFATRRRAKANEGQAEISALIKIQNLAKTYGDGYRAVDGISFEVARGQVVGLLGPNGAGKTTTLRMLMGLIHPTSGEIFLSGKKIYPGSPALSDLGSFVEGPGFLPHLTGRANLELYWRAIGRTDAPEFEQVLKITKLGAAVDKKVRSYSQGMRQRLAIAQAMLGLPDLLILDEPTNGLDPQQITEMRQVLRDYAATGRTVLISSHLLSEVEQTCSHVVLMHRGKLLAAGAIEELLDRERTGESLEEFFLTIIGDDLIIGKEKS